MQKDYEVFVEKLEAGIYEATGIPRENIHFEKEGGKYAPVGDRLLVKFAEHEDAWEVCGLYTQELFKAYQEGSPMEEIMKEITDDLERVRKAKIYEKTKVLKDYEKTKKRLRDQGYGENVWDVCLMNFANIAEIEKKAGKLDFVLADLGVSSMQIDDPKRGFSFREEGPLDLRLNPQAGVPASERLKEMDAEEIEGMLFENSDEPLAKELARAIMSAKRKKQPIETTSQLREIVEQVVLRTKPENPKEAVKKTCQRVFQALRIDVNSEFEVLDSFLEALPHILKPGGKAAILTFHSGEDRMVKKSFQYYAREGIYSDIAKDVIRPSAKECASNPRARSTKFRWAVRSDVQKYE